MIPDGNLDIHKISQNGKHVGKYKRHLSHLLIFLKHSWLLKANIVIVYLGAYNMCRIKMYDKNST